MLLPLHRRVRSADIYRPRRLALDLAMEFAAASRLIYNDRGCGGIPTPISYLAAARAVDNYRAVDKGYGGVHAYIP